MRLGAKGIKIMVSGRLGGAEIARSETALRQLAERTVNSRSSTGRSRIGSNSGFSSFIPELLGGPHSIMIGRVLWQEFFNNRDWPVASAVAIVMLLLLIVPIMWFHKHQQKQVGEHG